MNSNRSAVWLIVIAALGYFVDIFDLILFNVVKKESLLSIGLTGKALEQYDFALFNWQMTGMLVGGLVWGIFGDKKGRIKVLFGSILLYSIANIANAFVATTEAYAVWRFIAGFGLAGELGAGITLVVEHMEREKRGYGTMIIVTFGALGAVVAGLVARNGSDLAAFFHLELQSWQMAYITGGTLGLLLLLMRAGAYESGMFRRTVESDDIKRGDFFQLFRNRDRAIRYLACIAIGLPVWFVVGVLINQSDKLAPYIGVDGNVLVAQSVMFSYIGLSVGDLISGLLSQWLKSRKKVVFIYLVLLTTTVFGYLFNHHISLTWFYFMCFLLGASTGFWALFVTIASEQFGTNLRSTVTNTVPNFVRGATVPITLGFKSLKEMTDPGIAALIVGAVCIGLSFWACYRVDESFSKDLNFLELD